MNNNVALAVLEKRLVLRCVVQLSLLLNYRVDLLEEAIIESFFMDHPYLVSVTVRALKKFSLWVPENWFSHLIRGIISGSIYLSQFL